MFKKTKELILTNLDFEIPSEIFGDLSESEISEINDKIYTKVLEKIVERLASDLAEHKIEELTDITEKAKTPEEVVIYLAKNVNDSHIKVGEEILNFREDLMEIIK